MPERDVLICDVAPRDGLQNERVRLSPATRTRLCARLADAGLGRGEAGRFVPPHPRPARARAAEGVGARPPHDPTTWTGLALNTRGFDRAVASGLRHVNYTIAVTDSFSRRNQGASREDAVAAAAALAARARSEGIAFTVTLAVSFGCPFEGRVPARDTLLMAERALAWGPDELVFADTIGVAVPATVTAVLSGVASAPTRIGLHLHDTRNTAVANCFAALEHDVELFDASVGGTGGCPFAPGAGGNLATEDLVYALDESGVRTGIDLDALIRMSTWLGEQLGYRLPSSVARGRESSVDHP